MKFFDFFRKKPAVQTAASFYTKLANGIELSPALSAYREQIEKTAIPFIHIEALPGEQSSVFQSNFAGTPYWPISASYPTDEMGKPMFLLAQLNFSEITSLQDYPETGILQFFISADDMHGVNFEEPANQTNFRVVYHETVDEARAEKEFVFLTNTDLSNVPIDKPMRLHFSKQIDYIGSNDVRFQKNFGADLLSFTETFGEKDDEIGEELCDKFPNDGHKIGGYAYFTQEDPRIYKEEFKDWILLLQIDSDFDKGIMWGDMGVANFFIHPDDLIRKDFSRVMYTWDCC